MSDSSYLINSDSKDPASLRNLDSPDFGLDVLAEGYNCVPFLWLALMDPGCVTTVKFANTIWTNYDFPPEHEYPHFVTSANEGRRRFQSRLNFLLKSLPIHQRTIQSWEDFLSGITKAYIHLDFFEVSLQSDSETLLAELLAVIAAMDTESEKAFLNYFSEISIDPVTDVFILSGEIMKS